MFLADVIVPTLSNSLEALALAAAVLVSLGQPSARPTVRAVALGAIISLGRAVQVDPIKPMLKRQELSA